jgi:integrase/recombinase XerD
MNKPLSKHLTDFLEYGEIEKGLSPVTIKNYSRFLQRFFEWLRTHNLADISPGELTEKHVWQYRVWLSRLPNTARKSYTNLNVSTQTRYLIALRAFLGYFHEKNIPSLPTEKIKLPKEHSERRVKFLSLEHIERLFNSIDVRTASGIRDRAIIEVLFSTGMRVAELVSLDRKQIEGFKPGQDLEISIIGKGLHVRTVYFSPRAIIWIRKYLTTRKDADPALFIRFKGPTSDNLRLTTRAIEEIVQKHAQRAGLPILATPHTLRHSFATDLLNEGVDLRAVQEFLGHKNIATTQVYTHVTNKRLKDIHQKYHGGRKLTK